MERQVNFDMKKQERNIHKPQASGNKTAINKGLPRPFNSGFTLTELIAVLLIIGIITAVAFSRYTDIKASDSAAADTLRSHLRYAHLRAMGDTQPWSIVINNNSYTLQRNGNPVSLPGEGSATKTLKNTAILNPPGEIRFSSGRGIPIDNNGDPVEANQSFHIGAETITVTEYSGFIP